MIGSEISWIRKCSPQIVVSFVATLLLLDIGLSISYPAVLISALTGLNTESNPDETLRMTDVESSWMGSISYVGKLFGSLSCGFASENLGRRNTLILINFPLMLAFYLFYYSTTISNVFIANILLGFGAGFMKSPSSTYVSETSEVSLRGILISMTTLAISTGPLIVYFIANMTTWRNIALYFCIVQIITTISFFFVPESPSWLVSKQRDESAMKSLRWLRGWVPQNVVQNEFDSIKRCKELSNSCADCKSDGVKCVHLGMQTTAQAMKELIRKRTLKPFFILLTIGFVTYFSGTHHLNSYMVPILNTYRSPLPPNWAVVVVALTGFLGTFAGMVGLKLLGKRRLYLTALFGVTMSSFVLSIYGFINLPPNSKSYEHKKDTLNEGSLIPLILFCSMRFFTTMTTLVPFAMLSELFSMRSRSMATSLTTTTNNILTFTAAKSFYNFERWLDLPSSFGIYSSIGAFGLVIMYLILPETEGCSLEDIEMHFSDNSRKLTDWRIKPASKLKDKEPC